MPYDVRAILKEIARGRHGARSLAREEARALFHAILCGEVPDLALGAILTALRVKGESAAELAGMMDAVAGHVRPMRVAARRAQAVVIPTYNGARKLPNLVPLLALLLAREGVPVLLHGAFQEPQRVGTFEILALLGHPPAASVAEAEERIESRLLAPMPIALLAPDLARLIDARLVMGVRNSAHTLAKLLLPQGVPAAAACRLVSVTHPDFMALMREHFGSHPANVFLMRGLEGEAVVRLHAPQPIEQIDAEGRHVTHLLEPDGGSVELPERDAPATARWTAEVLEGKRAVPAALARQAALIASHCKSGERPPLRLVASK